MKGQAKNLAKFSDTCSVRDDGLCIGSPRLMGGRKEGNLNMQEFFLHGTVISLHHFARESFVSHFPFSCRKNEHRLDTSLVSLILARCDSRVLAVVRTISGKLSRMCNLFQTQVYRDRPKSMHQVA